MNSNTFEQFCEESKESDYETYKKAKPSNNLYIRPINHEDEIINFIQETGVQFTSCNIPTDRGFAFISVETNEDFDKILELDGTEFNNINMTVSIAKKNKKSIPVNAKTIFLSNIPSSVSKNNLRRKFNNNTIKSINFPIDRTKGYGFIEFYNHEDLLDALERKCLEIKDQTIDINISRDKHGVIKVSKEDKEVVYKPYSYYRKNSQISTSNLTITNNLFDVLQDES